VRSVTQLKSFSDVHAHPEGLVTLMGVPGPPSTPMVTLVGETEKEHDAAASVIVTSRPAMVSVPVRAAVVVFCATDTFTVPLPLPLVPDVIEIHPVPVAAVHAHPPDVVTVNELRVLPDAGSDSVVGLTE
jgi:hypothetical protein